MIYTIDTIERIYYINQYEDNLYNQYDRLTLQISPTQLHHWCFLFIFS